jgi:hypothetical protein
MDKRQWHVINDNVVWDLCNLMNFQKFSKTIFKNSIYDHFSSPI